MNTENNKLIAEFMQLDKANADIPLYIIEHSAYPINKLEYHSNWNWLMQVVEKIESLGNDVLITSNYIQIAYNQGEEFIVIELEGNIKIFSVYNACIKFIKWYNENKI